MDKLLEEKIGKAKVNPVFKGLSDELKDPKNFKGIENKLAKVMLADHKHKKIEAFNKCKRCQDKFTKKREMIKSLGFTGINQYQSWRKVMGYIINKKDLMLYEKK